MNTLFYVLEHESTAGADASVEAPKLYDMLQCIYMYIIIAIKFTFVQKVGND